MRFSKHCWQCPILVKLQLQRCSVRKVLLKIRKPQVYSCKFCETFKNNFFHRSPPVAAFKRLKAEAVARWLSVKKMFLEVSLNSQENTCAKVSFLQPQACNFIKIESLTQVFSCQFCKQFYNKCLFWRTSLVTTSVKACNFTKKRLCKISLCRWLFCKNNDTINCDDNNDAICSLTLRHLLQVAHERKFHFFTFQRVIHLPQSSAFLSWLKF